MPKIDEGTIVEDGMVLGYVYTWMVGSKCTFTIASVEEWEGMSDKEAEEAAMEALFCSGMMEWGY